MAEEDILQHQLLQAQNSDGGWAYQTGSSWTEPTALALLALAANAGPEQVRASGQTWLKCNQRADGGWGPQRCVNQSTWVTSLATLALGGVDSAAEQHRLGLSWLVGQILPADDPVGNFVNRLQGIGSDPRPAGGSAWFPGTAAWISPTVFSILALSDQIERSGTIDFKPYVVKAQQFILSRRCADGGWNHGGARDRSQTASSYPEMTGMALLALRGVDASELLFPLERAVRFLDTPTSSEALSWLQLGLLAQGRDHRTIKTDMPCRAVRDISLRLLVLAGTSSNNRLL